MQLIIAIILGGVAVALTNRWVRGFRVLGGFKDAMVIGAVYGLLKILLQKLLILLTLPMVILSLGLFIVVINAFLLWITQKLLKRLEIESAGDLLVSTIFLSFFDLVFHLVLSRGALF
jgi:putative membrane protein